MKSRKKENKVSLESVLTLNGIANTNPKKPKVTRFERGTTYDLYCTAPEH